MDSISETTKKEEPKTAQKGGIEAQTFNAIGLFEVNGGELILRGRHGERDHMYPLPRAIRMYHSAMNHVAYLARNGIRGWDVFMDVIQDFKAKILETVDNCRSLNIPQSQDVIDFYEKESGKKLVGNPNDVVKQNI